MVEFTLKIINYPFSCQKLESRNAEVSRNLGIEGDSGFRPVVRDQINDLSHSHHSSHIETQQKPYDHHSHYRLIPPFKVSILL